MTACLRGLEARHRERGFTLVEIAIAIFIITILLGSIMVPLTTQVEQRQVSETQKMLEHIKGALIGHAISRGHLPCTDVTSGAGANDGVEDVAAGTCVGTGAGNVPWVTLGFGTSDPWGNRFRYRVDTDFANRPPAARFTLGSSADLGVWTSTAETLRLVAPSPDGAVAVIFSYGKNGYYAINAATGTANPAAPVSNEDELENSGGSNYVSRTHTGVVTPCSDTVAGQPLCEFDDIVTWLSRFTLVQRMVAAGKLP